MTPRRGKGQFNSSATRIRPFFEALVKMDRTGRQWLPALLSAVGKQDTFESDLIDNPGPILKIVFESEKQGEQAIGPPEAFCRWLLEHPDHLVWPRGKAGIFADNTTRLRRALMGKAGDGDVEERQRLTMEEGLRELTERGVRRSARKWWAFEGETKVDCYIETSKLRLYVEGKRTEALSPATAWFPARNQFVRNLEAAREHAGEMPFACLLMTEVPLSITPAEVDAGLPHLSAAERGDLLGHYLGNITWRSACETTGILFTDLPNTWH